MATDTLTTPIDVREMLQEVIDDWSCDSGQGITPRSYEDAGVLTANEGLVLRMADGTEFQVTIVRSR